jgi:hypothetical protein
MDPAKDNASSEEAAPIGAGGIRFGPKPALVLFLLLFGSAVLALGTRRFPGLLPPALEVIVPGLFLLFLLCFALYRIVLVRAGKYPASKALFQIGAAVLFLTLLLPASKSRYDAPIEELEVLLTDDNPRVRAITAEVIGYRASGEKHAPLLVKALADPDPRVREQAHHSLVRLAGQDLGSGQSESERRAWENRFP